MQIPRLKDIPALFGAFTSSGPLGAAGAGAVASSQVSKIQAGILAAANRAGKILGPVLGTAGATSFASGAATAATASENRVESKYLGFTVSQIGGYLAVGLVGGYLLWSMKRRR